MSKPVVPPAPLASWEQAESERKNKVVNGSRRRPGSASTVTPLDAAFLCRVYRSVAWFGVFTTGLVFSASASWKIALSYAAGVLLGTLLLKTQEIFGRRLLRPKNAEPYTGWDRMIPLWVLVPGKYLLVTLALSWGIKNQVVSPIALGCGFMVVQLMIMAKLFGKVLSEQARPIREVYIDIDKKPGA